MNFRLVTFVALGTLLFAAMYSSTMYSIFAEIKTSCSGTSTTTQKCTTFDTETGKNDLWNCTTKDGGKTWSCTKHKAMTAGSISPGLSDALDVAIEKESKTTKVPQDFGLRDGDLLSKNSDDDLSKDSQITTDNDSPLPPRCPDEGPIPPDCTMKPPIK